MDTLLEMETSLTSKLMVAANSTIFTPTAKRTAISDAYRWAAGLFMWEEFLKAEDTDSGLNQEYYDYPLRFRTGSIVQLEYNGEEYDRKSWEDYLAHKRDNSSSTKKIFANYGRQYFIYPKPAQAIVKGITIWGSTQPAPITADGATTIFSYSEPEGNEAIVQRALGQLIREKNAKRAAEETKEATATLTRIYQLQLDRRQRDQRLNRPQFEVPDFFETGRSVTNIGRFSYDPSGE